MQVPGLLQIGHCGQRNHAFHCGLVPGKAQCELPPGRVAHDHDLLGIQPIARLNLRNEPVSLSDIFEGARPAAAGIPHTPVFHIPCRKTFPR